MLINGKKLKHVGHRYSPQKIILIGQSVYYQNYESFTTFFGL